MAQSKIQKIRLTLTKNHKKDFLEILQNASVCQIISVENFLEKNEEKTIDSKTLKEHQTTDLAQANTEFAINTLSPFAKKRGLFAGPIEVSLDEAKETYKTFDHQATYKKCKDSEDKITNAKNQIVTLEQRVKSYSKWEKLDLNLNETEGSKETLVKLGSIKTANFSLFKEALENISNLFSLQTVNTDPAETFFRIIFDKKIKDDIAKLLQENKFQEAELPKTNQSVKELIIDAKNEIKESKRVIKSETKELKKLAKDIENLMIVHDYLNWELEKLNAEKEGQETKYSTSIYAWVEKKYLNRLKKDLEEISREFVIEKLELEENEAPPVIIRNSKFMTPFEAVTNTYGLPLHNELDPTPYLSVFFIFFFALCLTDAGYGIVMFLTMWSAQKFLKLPTGMKKLVRLLMYGGVVTFIVGTLFGGWFGLQTTEVPSFLVSEDGSMFKGQIVNAINDPLTVLILSLVLGFVQILLGVFMKLFHDFKHFDKKEALIETGPWAVLLSGIGMFILSKTAITSSVFINAAMITLYTGLILIIGRRIVSSSKEVLKSNKGKNPLVVLINLLLKGVVLGGLQGALNLYDLVGYMSDVLSYSRLLALGLATAIIGMAVNTIAFLMKDMIPYVGWIFMILVFIGGHIFNLVINALGSFIHSGRLQFVEFFGKFMEGGGDEFKKFSKKSKYVYIKNN